MTLDTTKKYVHEGLEVVLTGRQAKKEQATTGIRGKVGRIPSAPSFVVEIVPANRQAGSWKKWVKLTELYEIMET